MGWLPGVKAWLLENGIRKVDRVSREIARKFKRKFGGGAKPLLKRDVITKEEILRVLKIAPLREKAIICALVSGGFRLSSCLNLQLRHFRDDVWNENLPCYAVKIPESLSKEGEPYVTFISAEAAEYIRRYLLIRKERGEELGPDTYIFTAKRKGTPLSDHKFENIWRKLCQDAGLDMKPIETPSIHPVGKKGEE